MEPFEERLIAEGKAGKTDGFYQFREVLCLVSQQKAGSEKPEDCHGALPEYS